MKLQGAVSDVDRAKGVVSRGVRGRDPFDVLTDTIQPFPLLAAPKALRGEIAAALQPFGQER